MKVVISPGNAINGSPNLTPIGKVRPYSAWFRILAGWASIPVNAIRYYVSGVDEQVLT